LQEPSEEHRREAEQAAKRAGIATPAGAAAQAVVFAQGSLSLPGLPEVPAPEDLTSQTIAGAVRVCAAQLGAAGETLPYRRMLRNGLEVAAGKNRWQESLLTEEFRGTIRSEIPWQSQTSTRCVSSFGSSAA